MRVRVMCMGALILIVWFPSLFAYIEGAFDIISNKNIISY